MDFSNYKYWIIFIRAVVVEDTHTTNVNAFNFLLNKFFWAGVDEKYFISISKSSPKILKFFDYVHILKNIRNSLISRIVYFVDHRYIVEDTTGYIYIYVCVCV